MKKGKKENKGIEEATTKLPKMADKTANPAAKFLPPKVFALHRAASSSIGRPELRVVRIEPQKAMATDGTILLTIIPAEEFSVDKPFTVDAEMCAQILKAKTLSGEDAAIQLSDGAGQPVITVGNYRFSPSAQLELFPYELTLEQKSKSVGKVRFGVAVMEKLMRSLRAVGAENFSLEFAGKADPVKVSANANSLDFISGAIMPMRM